jgi:hypothetical protein
VSTVSKPHSPPGPEPAREDDPTGVRALLSSLPQPDPMPEHLVERINASLAAEQAHRSTSMSRGSVSPLSRARPRHGRLILALAGAAAALLVGTAVGSSVFNMNPRTEVSGSAALASTSNPREDSVETPQAEVKAAAPAAGGAPASKGLTLDDSEIQVRLSGTRYTKTDFVTQAGALHSAAAPQARLAAASSLGPVGTTVWLRECMNAIGAAGTQVIRADVAFYEGHPAVIIVASAGGRPVAFVVAPQCSHADPAVLRQQTPLP